MHKFDYSVPHFVTRVRGTCIVVTSDIVSEVLHVPRVAHPDYLGYDHLRTVSKDEFSSLFCETPSSQDDCQNTPCQGFAKGLKFLNMVMTFVLERLFIDFPYHFILSLIDFYRDTTTYDKLIFPSAIMRLLHHFSVSYPESTHFSVMCAIDATTIRRSEAQLRPKQPWIEIVASPASSAPSISVPS